MAIYALPDTRIILGNGHLPECMSRALFKDRFADPEATDKIRKEWFKALIARKSDRPASSPWLPGNALQLHARLMSRLIVDLAGGVMENANVNLDRYGLPIIPGSAVKGCARRMALQALHDWIAAQTDKGSAGRPATDDACAPCCEEFTKPADMLASIARVFGWTPDDWKSADKTKDGHYRSDFAWATAGNKDILIAAKHLNPDFEVFAGSIAFLAASPNRDPGLELDVVTPHHIVYHSPEPDRNRDRQKWHTWQAHRSAPDTEDPVPVFFPAVKPQGENDYFTFPLIPVRLAKVGDISLAKRWLAHGLELLGLGAKSNAGYGWFDASDTLQRSVSAKQEATRKEEEERHSREAELARRKEADEAARRKKEEEAAATAGMTDDEKVDYQIAQLSDVQFQNKVKNFFKEPKKGGPSDREKGAIVRSLRAARIDYWKEFKKIAAKGGDLARAEQAIRAHNNQLNGDKMP